MSVANIAYAMLAGVGFAAVLLRTRTIWLVMAAHALIVFANLLSGAFLSGNAVTVAETAAAEHAVRNALTSVLATVPLFVYGLWLLRDPRRLTRADSAMSRDHESVDGHLPLFRVNP